MPQQPGTETVSPPSIPPEVIPPVEVPHIDRTAAAEAATDFDGDNARLDINVRRIATYGGLGLATGLYLLGVIVICKAMQIWPLNCEEVFEITSQVAKVTECPRPLIKENWHAFVGALVALFSVPTVLMITVMRAVGGNRKDTGADNVYAAIGEKVVSAVEKFVGGDK